MIDIMIGFSNSTTAFKIKLISTLGLAAFSRKRNYFCGTQKESVSRDKICAYKYGRHGDLSAKSLSSVLGNI